jgi:hypothetical protein
MGDPYINIFSGVDYPLLKASDIAKGAWRGAYEGLRSRPLKTSVSHAVSQTIGSAIGRMVDTQDDKTGIAML